MKLYINSEINCIRDGMIERGLTVRVRKRVITATVITIDREEFVNEIS